MNNVVLIGRLTKDPAMTYTQGSEPLAIARYSLAVNRRFKKDEADFINCVTFGKNAEFAEKFLKKGNKIAIAGRIQTGSYEKDGRRIYTTDVVVEQHEFCEGKGTEKKETTPDDGFMKIPDGLDEELPFN